MGKKKSVQRGGNAVIYARYSSHSQRDVSIEQQLEACEKYAADAGYRIVGRYADRAMSGKTDNRPQFQQMMKDAHEGGFDFVIAWKSNRMGRNMLQAMVNESKLAELGIRCLYVEEDFDDTAAGRFALRNMMNVNQFYSENMAEDIRRGLMDNAQKCKVNGKIPLGYKRGPAGEYVIEEAAAAVVREIYQRIIDGWPIVEIMDDLNRRGIRTKTGGEWKKQSFDKVLQNENYIGVYKYSSVRIEDGIPPIIDRAQFEEVQHILKTKANARGKARRNSSYLLRGKVFCGLCGAPMMAQCGTARNGTRHDYYECNARRYEHSCTKRNVPKAALEKAVVECIRSELLNDDLIDWIVAGYQAALEEAQDRTELEYLQAELADVNIRLQNVMRAIEAGIFNELTQARMDELRMAKNDLESAIRTEEVSFQFPEPDEIRFALLSYRDGDFDDPIFLKELIRTFVNAVFVYDDYLLIRLNYGKDRKETPPGAAHGAVDSVHETTDNVHHRNRLFLMK